MKIQNLLEEIASELRISNSDKRMWSAGDIAAYMGLSKSTVQQRIICKPDFPRSVKIPTGDRFTNRRWYPQEVKNWIKRHQGKR